LLIDFVRKIIALNRDDWDIRSQRFFSPENSPHDMELGNAGRVTLVCPENSVEPLGNRGSKTELGFSISAICAMFHFPGVLDAKAYASLSIRLFALDDPSFPREAWTQRFLEGTRGQRFHRRSQRVDGTLQRVTNGYCPLPICR
jgi:hypothetical protein